MRTALPGALRSPVTDEGEIVPNRITACFTQCLTGSQEPDETSEAEIPATRAGRAANAHPLQTTSTHEAADARERRILEIHQHLLALQSCPQGERVRGLVQMGQVILESTTSTAGRSTSVSFDFDDWRRSANQTLAMARQIADLKANEVKEAHRHAEHMKPGPWKVKVDKQACLADCFLSHAEKAFFNGDMSGADTACQNALEHCQLADHLERYDWHTGLRDAPTVSQLYDECDGQGSFASLLGYFQRNQSPLGAEVVRRDRIMSGGEVSLFSASDLAPLPEAPTQASEARRQLREYNKEFSKWPRANQPAQVVRSLSQFLEGAIGTGKERLTATQRDLFGFLIERVAAARSGKDMLEMCRLQCSGVVATSRGLPLELQYRGPLAKESMMEAEKCLITGDFSQVGRHFAHLVRLNLATADLSACTSAELQNLSHQVEHRNTEVQRAKPWVNATQLTSDQWILVDRFKQISALFDCTSTSEAAGMVLYELGEILQDLERLGPPPRNSNPQFRQ
ncbi:hypothetical protein OU995_21735 [Roseateles sp. SL47]|uniref:hypothetical protein n=1 Tax=Roseateles sp. SL47 TaxID=2995138 RepID=UPI00226E9896|nr:hypothetical protein [Roseateles sp. SL47]WAC72157.1 hypothetical protein OU995_21735 [Roseateles sp. SL47]